MVMVVPGKDYTKSWNSLADAFSGFAQTRDNAYQRQRQEESDARAAAYHAKRMQDLGLDITEKERIVGNRLSPEQFAREATVANARQPIPTLPSNFDQYPGEQGRQPSPTMFGYKGPTEYDRNVARANMMRGVTSDEALTWKRLEDAASTIEKREQDATKAFQQGQIDEVTFNKFSVQLSREKQALDQASKEAQFEINKKRDDARWGKTRADQSDFDLQRDQKLSWAQSVLSDTDKPAYELEGAPQLGFPDRIARVSQIPEDYGLYGGTTKDRELKKARDIYSVYGKKTDPTVADAVTGKIGWPELDKKIKASGYSRVQLGEELAKHMKNVAGSSDDFTADEQAVSSEAILEALLQLQNINPQKDWLSEYRKIKSDKTNFIRETGSRHWYTAGVKDDDWDPLTSEEIALIMLMKESQKRKDPQYESDKKRFKDKFGWIPKWA